MPGGIGSWWRRENSGRFVGSGPREERRGRRALSLGWRTLVTGQRYGVFGDLIPFALLRRQHDPAARFQFQRFHDHQISVDFRFALMFSMFSTKHFGQKPTWKYLCPQGNVGMIVDLTLIPSPSPDGITSHGTP